MAITRKDRKTWCSNRRVSAKEGENREQNTSEKYAEEGLFWASLVSGAAGSLFFFFEVPAKFEIIPRHTTMIVENLRPSREKSRWTTFLQAICSCQEFSTIQRPRRADEKTGSGTPRRLREMAISVTFYTAA